MTVSSCCARCFSVLFAILAADLLRSGHDLGTIILGVLAGILWEGAEEENRSEKTEAPPKQGL